VSQGPRGTLADVGALAQELSGRSGVIVSGADSGEGAVVQRLAETLGWPVLADARSSARLPAPRTVTAFDALLRHQPFAAKARPEIILRLGGVPASKVLAGWSASSGAEQWVVGPAGSWLDPERSMDRLLVADPTEVCTALADHGPKTGPDDWTRLWAEGQRTADEAIGRTLAAHEELTEPGVARNLVAGLPEKAVLVVASSMPIRDVEWYGSARPGISVLANRGANGIDGTVSTALGVAAASEGRPTVGLVGDLAFLHDAGALVGARDRGLDLVLVVIDNRGGGIFSFLPQATAVAAPLAERLFGTPHHVDLVALAGVHGLTAFEIEGADQLVPAVTSALASGGITVLVARTDRQANVEVHDQIHAAVAAALEASSV
jgi:2-succinyl-5-enolpyruvyl-6-hydroxy-3-cyclohexene-1-carboxylate synthase